MSYLFCESHSEMKALVEYANRDKVQVLQELSCYVRSSSEIGIEIKPVLHTFGIWSVEADLTFNGEIVRHYDAYDLLVLDLYHIELSIIAKGLNRMKATQT